MTTPDDHYSPPDGALADSAMDTGSDAGEPGGHLGPGDLEPEEERLLAALERDTASQESAGPETYAAVRAAEDEAPLPERGGPQDDGLTPRFSSPGEA